MSSGFATNSLVKTGWIMQVGSWALCFGPSTLVLIFHIFAVGSFTLLSLMYSAFSVSFSSLIMSSRSCKCDCLRLVCFWWDMHFGLYLMPNASISISNFNRLSAVCLKTMSWFSSISLTISGALLSDMVWYLSHPSAAA